MRTLLIAAIGIALLIIGLSSNLAKYDYCYDADMAANYALPKPNFTEYGLESEHECNNR